MPEAARFAYYTIAGWMGGAGWYFCWIVGGEEYRADPEPFTFTPARSARSFNDGSITSRFLRHQEARALRAYLGRNEHRMPSGYLIN